MEQNVIQINEYQCECKKGNICEKDYVWNTAKYNCENQKYLESIMDNSGIIWDEVIDAGAKLSQKEDNDKKKLFQQIL